MTDATIDDLDSVSRIYPREAFDADAAENDRPGGLHHKGVRILTGPDENGVFRLERCAGDASQTSGGEGAVFLAPFRRSEPLVDKGRYGAAEQVGSPEPESGYHAFLREIIGASRKLALDSADRPGAGDARLRGPRQ